MSRRIMLFLDILCSALVLSGLGVALYTYLSTVSNYPLPIGYPESNRLINAAQIYSPILFGRSLPWPLLDASRAILDGLVLLIPNSQIWMFRLWQVVQMFVTTTLASILIVRNAQARSLSIASGRKDPLVSLLLIGWGILFLLQTPEYSHVLLGVLFVLWLSRVEKPGRTLLVVVLASLWGGLGRVNWFVMPAVTAILLYLFATPFAGKKLFPYLKWPVLWFVSGLLSSFLVYLLWIKTSGHIIPFLDPEMNYAFFRFKLWPNSDSALGLIPGMALVTLPGLVLVLAGGWKNLRRVHWLRWLGFAGILGTFFVGSTVISIRSGGGFDLHNYDTFTLLFFIVTCYWGLGAVRPDRSDAPLPRALWGNRFAFLGVLVVPLVFTLSGVALKLSMNTSQTAKMEAEAQKAIYQVRSALQTADLSRGPVLFIDFRGLIVYHMVPETDWYFPYEKIELMEMAMAGNAPYLTRFVQQVQQQEFSLIITEPLNVVLKDVNTPYGYENNVWVDSVSYPILNNYDLVYINKSVGLAIYAPKPR